MTKENLRLKKRIRKELRKKKDYTCGSKRMLKYTLSYGACHQGHKLRSDPNDKSKNPTCSICKKLIAGIFYECKEECPDAYCKKCFLEIRQTDQNTHSNESDESDEPDESDKSDESDESY